MGTLTTLKNGRLQAIFGSKFRRKGRQSRRVRQCPGSRGRKNSEKLGWRKKIIHFPNHQPDDMFHMYDMCNMYHTLGKKMWLNSWTFPKKSKRLVQINQHRQHIALAISSVASRVSAPLISWSLGQIFEESESHHLYWPISWVGGKIKYCWGV